MSVFDPLTLREKHITLMIAEGKTNRQIAAALEYAPGSVRNYVGVILKKLNCDNRIQLATLATQHNLYSTRFWETSPKANLESQVLELYNKIADSSHSTAAAVIEALC